MYFNYGLKNSKIYHEAMVCLITDPLFPTSCIFSWIFSKTRGTPKKKVGSTSFKVFTSDPFYEIKFWSFFFSLHVLVRDLPSRHFYQQSTTWQQPSKEPKHPKFGQLSGSEEDKIQTCQHPLHSETRQKGLFKIDWS